MDEQDSSSDSSCNSGYDSFTPPSSDGSDNDNVDNQTSHNPPQSNVPKPGLLYTIRSVTCGRYLTLLDGQVVLRGADVEGCKIWTCISTQGWLGFRNISSGSLLGHDSNGNICCTAKVHRDWERLHIRHMAEGGYNILLTHRPLFSGLGFLWSIDSKVEAGVEKLVKVDGEVSQGLVWEFIRVVK